MDRLTGARYDRVIRFVKVSIIRLTGGNKLNAFVVIAAGCIYAGIVLNYDKICWRC